MIAVLGGKGGVGKSVLTANLASAFASEFKTPTLLIDADGKSCGDHNVLFNLRPQKTVSEVAQYNGPISQQTLTQIITPHSSGVHVIGAVRSPEEKLVVNVDMFLKHLESFSRIYKFIVVDLGSELGDFQLQLLKESTAGLVVSSPEILVVNQTQRLIGELLSLTFPLDMFQLVINKSSSQGLNPNLIMQSLKMPIFAQVPLDEVSCQGSIQRGTPFVLSQAKIPISTACIDLTKKLMSGILQKLKTQNASIQIKKSSTSGINSQTSGSGGIASSQQHSSETQSAQDARNAVKFKIHTELIKAMDLKKGITETNNDPVKEQALRQKTLQMLTQIVDREIPQQARDERSKIIKEVLEEALGLGPLEDLLSDNAVTEIMVNGFRKIFIEKSGKVTLSPVTFTSNMHLRNVIERIVTPLGRRIDEKTPYVDARLKDGSRVNAVIEPLSIDGPALTIRKFKKGGITAEKYLEYGSLSKPMVDFLKICVENGKNLVISGGTGSGKTSLLNMLSGYIPASERVVTVEDAAELQLAQEHVVRLETRPANMEGTGAVTIRDLVRNALRMRPDRIVVGECRDGAALDMLSAMNTGHDGSMTTTHANSPRECLSRLETLCLMAGMDLPIRAIREQVSSAVHLIVQIQRLSDGSRKVTSVTEVCGMQGETVTMQEIFRFKETGFDKNRKIIGTFQAMGMIPTFVEKLEQKGVSISRDIFSNDPKLQGTPQKAGPQLSQVFANVKSSNSDPNKKGGAA